MIPGTFQLALYQGDSDHWQFVLWTDAAKTQPADLTGVVANAQIRDKPGGNLLATLTCTVTQPNIVDVVLDATQSGNLTGSKGAWDLHLTYPNGDVLTPVAGTVAITLDVTQSA